MPDAVSPLLAALDRSPVALDIFVRDDDAGWDDARLLALLDVMGDAATPIDLAAIPLAIAEGLARELNRRIDATPDLLGVHQHGLAHTNHQAEGRKCEFGSGRDAARQRDDLQRGRERLQQRFGHRLDPYFTPPWNRCASATSALLAELGYAALSRDRGATPQQALPELPVDVDWSRHHRAGGPEAVARSLVEAIGARGLDRKPLGLMLHHAAMDDSEFALLRHWLAALGRHPRLRWQSMRALVARRLCAATPPEPAATS
jgi:hypothetical protein